MVFGLGWNLKCLVAFKHSSPDMVIKRIKVRWVRWPFVISIRVLPKNPLWKIVIVRSLFVEILHIVWWSILFWAILYIRNASQIGQKSSVLFSVVFYHRTTTIGDIKEIMKHLSRLLVVGEKVLASVISLHQQLLMLLLPLMMLWPSGDW